jgi:hypothetical protein
MYSLIKEIKELIKIQGCHLPTLYLFSEEKAIVVDAENDKIVNAIYCNPFPDLYGIFHTKITFNFKTFSDEQKMYSFIQKIVKMYRPKTIGFVAQGRCADLSDEESNNYKKGSIINNPKSIKFIQIVLYADDLETGYETTIPFYEPVNKKVNPDNNNNSFVFMDYPWAETVGEHDTDFKNPYL